MATFPLEYHCLLTLQHQPQYPVLTNAAVYSNSVCHEHFQVYHNAVAYVQTKV